MESGELNDKIQEYYAFNRFDIPSDGSISNPDYLAIAEWLNLRDWLTKFPEGILSVVSDTFNLWKLITFILPRLKDEILARDGKLVIRPDSGDPVDITCGTSGRLGITTKSYLSTNEEKGVVELLWNIFGGTVNEQGYKCLDSHIGAIYGDSINLERQIQIYERLAAKGFAATNIVLGVGSYTYVYITRDNEGFAAKGCWFETKSEGNTQFFDIYKDPITDDGTKKSLKGFILVQHDGDDYVNIEGVSEEVWDSSNNILQTIYEDGKFYNQTTLTEIRSKLNF